MYDLAENWLPEVDRHDVMAHHEEQDEWESVPWRDSLWTNEDEPKMAGEVSSNDDYYNIIQYPDIIETVATGMEQHDDVHPAGHITLTPSRHKMTGKIGFGETVEAAPGDEIEMQLHVRSGHSGYHRMKLSVGAERLVCSNGMTAFVEDQVYEQTHSDPFQKGLVFHAVDSVIEGTDVVEQRLERAQERTLMNRDEGILVLQDLGIDRYLENPTADLVTAFEEEVDDPYNPSLYDTYNAATYALTHLADDEVPEHGIDNGYEMASQLLEYGNGIPDPGILGGNAVERRYDELLEGGDSVEEYWSGEREAVAELAEEHGITV